MRSTIERHDTDPEPSHSTLRELHQAHMLAIPFENLSIHYGQPIRLEEDALYDKIVRRHRGGFCYELNGLFAGLLRRLGFSVSLLSARVAQADGGFTPEFDHLALRVHNVDGVDWLADVGFGDSFRLPLRLHPEIEQEGADGKRYRLLHEAHDAPWLLQQRNEQIWNSQYRFTLQPHSMDEFVARCLFHQTSPDSHFTQKRICSLALPDGRITLSDLRLITTHRGVREERELDSEDMYREILAERFGVRLESPPLLN
jgi:N-hydroxyarylamine O-acetyltransferase